jgi:succinate dehydrogenase flavin-adding protein (antitoxin of CptAB toxin-antitoxin module)
LSAILIDEIRETGRAATDGRKAAGPRDAADGELIEAATELGIWLSGLECFVRAGDSPFGTEPVERGGVSGDLLLILSVVRKCSILGHYVRCEAADRGLSDDKAAIAVTPAELIEFCDVFSDLSMLKPSASPMSRGELNSFIRSTLDKPFALSSFHKFTAIADSRAERYLPSKLLDLVDPRARTDDARAAVALSLPRIARILRWLSVVGEMLKNDMPLRPSLVIFTKIYEQISELTQFINARLDELDDQEADAFSMLDATSYTASIELKKVFTQELSDIIAIRQAPTLFARIETAYALLTESFQHTLTGFARLDGSEVTVFDLFPNFSSKKTSSIGLRGELRNVSRAVQKAEADPSDANLASLRKLLDRFMEHSVRSLFFKDIETFERFVEEVRVARTDNDLVPILHRFGAYLETLFGQVSLRSVLAEHPFDDA